MTFQARFPDGSIRDTPWAYFNWTSEAGKRTYGELRERIGIVIAGDTKRGNLELIGNAFVVGDVSSTNHGDLKLLMTVAHNLRAALAGLRPESIEVLSRPLATHPIRLIGKLVKDNHVRVIFFHGNVIKYRVVRMVFFYEHLDLALIAIAAKDKQDFSGRLGFDSDRLALDQTLMTAGYVMEDIGDLEVSESGSLTRQVKRRLEARVGTLVETMHESPPIQSCTYRLNVPIRPGMSGSPVFAFDADYSPLRVVGICSRDFSPSLDDPHVAGDSRVVAAEAIYALFMPVAESKSGAKSTTGRPTDPLGLLLDDTGKNIRSLRLVRQGEALRMVRIEVAKP